MKNGNRYSFNPHRKIILQVVAMCTGKFGYSRIRIIAYYLFIISQQPISTRDRFRIGKHRQRLPDPFVAFLIHTLFLLGDALVITTRFRILGQGPARFKRITQAYRITDPCLCTSVVISRTSDLLVKQFHFPCEVSG